MPGSARQVPGTAWQSATSRRAMRLASRGRPFVVLTTASITQRAARCDPMERWRESRSLEREAKSRQELGVATASRAATGVAACEQRAEGVRGSRRSAPKRSASRNPPARRPGSLPRCAATNVRADAGRQRPRPAGAPRATGRSAPALRSRRQISEAASAARAGSIAIGWDPHRRVRARGKRAPRQLARPMQGASRRAGLDRGAQGPPPSVNERAARARRVVMGFGDHEAPVGSRPGREASAGASGSWQREVADRDGRSRDASLQL